MSQSPYTVDEQIERLVAGLDSLVDGDNAATMLTTVGIRAVPYLEHFLLDGRPRTISLPRCRAVHVLGELGAYLTLIAYFRRYKRPADAAVLFAEDAVRSVAPRAEFSFAEKPQIFCISARNGLDAKQKHDFSRLNASGIPLLEEALMRFLVEERAQSFLKNMYERTTVFLAQRSHSLEPTNPQEEFRSLSKQLLVLQDAVSAKNEGLRRPEAYGSGTACGGRGCNSLAALLGG